MKMKQFRFKDIFDIETSESCTFWGMKYAPCVTSFQEHSMRTARAGWLIHRQLINNYKIITIFAVILYYDHSKNGGTHTNASSLI
jgi:hypothetical protein